MAYLELSMICCAFLIADSSGALSFFRMSIAFCAEAVASFLLPSFALNLRLLVVHEVGVWVLLQRLVDPLRRLRHVLGVVVVKGGGLISGARAERSLCANCCI